jgi:hypothetical protein
MRAISGSTLTVRGQCECYVVSRARGRTSSRSAARCKNRRMPYAILSGHDLVNKVARFTAPSAPAAVGENIYPAAKAGDWVDQERLPQRLGKSDGSKLLPVIHLIPPANPSNLRIGVESRAPAARQRCWRDDFAMVGTSLTGGSGGSFGGPYTCPILVPSLPSQQR